jgi:hypothetical protein
LPDIIQSILDWSEVWAPLIPLLLLSFKGKQARYLTPVILYLWFALVIDAIIDAGWKFSGCIHSRSGTEHNLSQCVPDWMYPNNYLYNVHSLGRLFCFSAFFYLLSPSFRTRLDKLLLAGVLAFIVINFLFLQHFYERKTFSSRLFALESGVLLFCCLRYYLVLFPTVVNAESRSPAFWVVTGLSIYVVFNFFFFLFYSTLASKVEYQTFLANMWNFHNITFIILCIFIAKAYHVVGDQ